MKEWVFCTASGFCVQVMQEIIVEISIPPAVLPSCILPGDYVSLINSLVVATVGGTELAFSFFGPNGLVEERLCMM